MNKEFLGYNMIGQPHVHTSMHGHLIDQNVKSAFLNAVLDLEKSLHLYTYLP